MSLRGRNPEPLPVGRLLFMLKQSVGRAFPTLLVSGEVLDPLVSARGHLYFRLTDGQAEIRAVMWKREVARLSRIPVAGDRVTARGSLDIYAPRGDLQLQVAALMQSGRGQKMLQLAELKKRLKQEGLFDLPRRPLPRFPSKIGVVTSVGSAVLHDIFQSVQKRYPAAQLVVSPAAVGGPSAATEVVQALDRFRTGVDVVLICRGGGSFEELLPFSDEALVRKVADFTLPVVAAIGHGSDQSLLDLVADHTAPTPTAAAVLVTPDSLELARELKHLKRRLQAAATGRLSRERQELRSLSTRCRFRHPGHLLARRQEKLTQLQQRMNAALSFRRNQSQQNFLSVKERLERNNPIFNLVACRGRLADSKESLLRAMEQKYVRERTLLTQTRRRLQAVGPKAVLERGFALVQSGSEVVTSCQGRTPGEELELHLADGRLIVEVKRVERAQRDEPNRAD